MKERGREREKHKKNILNIKKYNFSCYFLKGTRQMKQQEVCYRNSLKLEIAKFASKKFRVECGLYLVSCIV